MIIMDEYRRLVEVQKSDEQKKYEEKTREHSSLMETYNKEINSLRIENIKLKSLCQN